MSDKKAIFFNSKRPKKENDRFFINGLSKVSENQSNEDINNLLKLYYTIDEVKIDITFAIKINAVIEKHISKLIKQADIFFKMSNKNNCSVESIYSGMAGIALLFKFYASKTNNKHKTFEQSKQIIEKCLKILDSTSKRITYLTGKSGVYVTAASIYLESNDHANMKLMIDEIVGMLPLALDPKTSDEILYGRAGYLYSLMVLKNLGWNDVNSDDIIRQVVSAILDSGMSLCSKENIKTTPIMYEWHEKKYFGAAHGLLGILHCLLLMKNYLTQKELYDLIKPALDYLLTLQFKSGNLPSSLNNDKDRLVQWCHGAAGATQTFLLAYEILKDTKYLIAAEQFGDVIWERGLLIKGYGLCHGLSGNTYAFISLFKVTKKFKHLYRAAKFIDWCLTNDSKIKELNRSFSMFEGIAGNVYTLLDVQNPLQANFPGY
ncbi:lanC-like protein 2 [Daktulosphaira vitifoliae]|uniref:lanC-like protein 2 n=1 Tax=Daktulosphaira vitifoliae TaxID=58002 RepID=UPI0021AA780F|nr:lanC-like protein 2 [Daktulosphaira vitifoliae]